MRHRCPFGGLIDSSPISRSPDGLLRPAQSFLPERLRELRLRRQPQMNLDCALLHGSVKLTGAAGPCQNGNLNHAARFAAVVCAAFRVGDRWHERCTDRDWPSTLEWRTTADYFFSVSIQPTRSLMSASGT